MRNGSGIPINTAGSLDTALQEFMTGAAYNPYPVKDYTFTGQIRPMKLVFFDLQRDTTRLDSSRYSEPLAFPATLIAHPPRTVQASDLYYDNKIMNFYGDSFHVTTPGYNYAWNYEPREFDSNGCEYRPCQFRTQQNLCALADKAGNISDQLVVSTCPTLPYLSAVADNLRRHQ